MADNGFDGEEPWEHQELLGRHRQDSYDSDDDTPKWKKYAKIILPHVGLTLLSCLYIVLGALVFYYIEQPHELTVRKIYISKVAHQRQKFLEAMWNYSHASSKVDEDMWKDSARIEIENITKILFDAFESDYITADVLNTNGTTKTKWTFIASIFFTSTLLTTIGYGNLVPLTLKGRMFCVCYGLFGIPLILITVADLGKFLSEHIIWLYTKYTKVKRKLKSAVLNRLCPQVCTPNTVDAEQSAVEDEMDNMGLYEYVGIPVSLILLILVGYTALGAAIMSAQEDWTFFNAFYYSFITMTTVGFGDLVPDRQAYVLLDLLYIIIGLAITTMCIDLVGVQYIRKIHYFGRAIQDARFALVNVGGKMVHVSDLVRYANMMKKNEKYGKMSKPIVWPGAYRPQDLKYIRYIDYIPGSKECLYTPNLLEPTPAVISTDPSGSSVTLTASGSRSKGRR